MNSLHWDDEKEAEFQRKRQEWFEEEAQQQREHASHNQRNGIKCPNCGSHNYIEATKVETCNDCGYEQLY